MTIDLQGAWIYVFVTASDYRRFKIGKTKNNPLSRLKKLRTGDPNIGLHTAYFVPTALAPISHVESSLHREFSPERISFPDDEGRSEWFRGEISNACGLIECYFAGWFGSSLKSINGHNLYSGDICKAYEEDLLALYGPPVIIDEGDDFPW